MKRFSAILLCIVVLCSGCGIMRNTNIGENVGEKSSSSVVTKDDSTSSNEKVGQGVVSNEASVENTFDAQSIVDNISVKSYTYDSSYDHNLVIVLTNNSDADCELSFSVDLKDDNDEIVGTESQTIDAFAAGTEVALTFYCDDEFKSYEYSMEVKELEYYRCVTQNLACKVNIATDKSIISVTNEGDVDAEFVKFTALYFKNDVLVYTDWGYVIDDDSMIKSGKTQKEESYCYENFDTVKVYLDSRASEF